MDQLEEQISKFSLLLTGSSSRPLPETETFLLSLVCRQCFQDKKNPLLLEIYALRSTCA